MSMAIIEMFLVMTMLPILAVAQSQQNITRIAPATIDGTGTRSCPSFKQREYARKVVADQIHFLLHTQGYFKIDNCGEGVWYNLVSINMLDPLSQCPDGWVEENVGVRACGRGSVGGSCKSAIFSSDDREYSKVCGRVIGYQQWRTQDFNKGGARGRAKILRCHTH